MIMGISVVFAFDRGNPIQEAQQKALSIAAQIQPTKVNKQANKNAGSNTDGKIIVSQTAIEADILMEEAPLILESTDGERAIVNGLNDMQPVDGIPLQQDKGHRSLKLALLDMQQALERLEREAELARRAVALMEQEYR